MPEMKDKKYDKRRYAILKSRHLKKRHLILVIKTNNANDAKIAIRKAKLAIHKMNRQEGGKISFTILAGINED